MGSRQHILHLIRTPKYRSPSRSAGGRQGWQNLQSLFPALIVELSSLRHHKVEGGKPVQKKVN
jgi:hypothetical protein